MKKIPLHLSTKIWLTVTISILVTILFSYFISDYLYEKLYVENVEKTLLEEGERLALEYEGGETTDDFREKIEWYNSKSDSEVFLVNNPKELSACFPFEIHHETIISKEERELLLEGQTIEKIGYEERINRNIISVIIPLLDEGRLEGILFLYVPLAKITELTKYFSYFWIIGGILFLIVSIFLGTILVNKITTPLKILKNAADEMSKGDYSIRVNVASNDEVGQLASAFNEMAASIEKEDERKKDFIAVVSHELRTPISYIKGYCEALVEGFVKDEGERTKYLSLIFRESKRMESLVRDLLNLSKLEAKEYEIEKVPLPLAQIVEDATEKYVRPIKEKGLAFQLDLDPEVIILGNESKIGEVIQNIVDNALRYTEKGKIEITLTKKDADYCKLVFKDTGIGIPEKDIKHITERFYRVNKARTRADGGTGLGLAITKNIVQLHDGQMEIKSKLGKGTTIEIYFPMLNDD